MPPSQAKYVYCPRGSLLDVVIDVRVGSPTFGQWDAVRLDPVECRALYLAEGLGHAFVALEDDTNGDRLVDVVQVFAGGQLARQDEDTDFDGVIDQRFEGDKPAAVPPGAKISATKFGPLDCGRFSEFWTRR